VVSHWLGNIFGYSRKMRSEARRAEFKVGSKDRAGWSEEIYSEECLKLGNPFLSSRFRQPLSLAWGGPGVGVRPGGLA
jgi:hypothetical protein